MVNEIALCYNISERIIVPMEAEKLFEDLLTHDKDFALQNKWFQCPRSAVFNRRSVDRYRSAKLLYWSSVN